jgi:hypothetical protein
MTTANFEPCEDCHEAPINCEGPDKCDIAKKKISEREYTRSTDMEAYQKRVVAEKEDLDVKIKKLSEFLDGETRPFLTTGKMMERQLVLMELYSQTLADRIALF